MPSLHRFELEVGSRFSGGGNGGEEGEWVCCVCEKKEYGKKSYLNKQSNTLLFDEQIC